MSVIGLLHPEVIALDPPWSGFRDTVAGLVSILVAVGRLAPDRQADAVRAVVTREAEQSTAVLDTAVGVPHARLQGLSATSVALGVSNEGFYEPVPTVRIRIVALVLSPPGASDEHLRVLAGIATLLRSSSLRRALLDASSREAAWEALKAHAHVPP